MLARNEYFGEITVSGLGHCRLEQDIAGTLERLVESFVPSWLHGHTQLRVPELVACGWRSRAQHSCAQFATGRQNCFSPTRV